MGHRRSGRLLRTVALAGLAAALGAGLANTILPFVPG
jgi:hypothetical protein